jgi:hypothetical protein
VSALSPFSGGSVARSYSLKVLDWGFGHQGEPKMLIIEPELQKLEVTVDNGRLMIKINGMSVSTTPLTDGTITIEKT